MFRHIYCSHKWSTGKRVLTGSKNSFRNALIRNALVLLANNMIVLLHRPWGSGEPNNHRDSEDCAEIWDSLLNDKNCEQPLQFICERPKGRLK